MIFPKRLGFCWDEPHPELALFILFSMVFEETSIFPSDLQGFIGLKNRSHRAGLDPLTSNADVGVNAHCESITGKDAFLSARGTVGLFSSKRGQGYTLPCVVLDK